ncbi:hypothetical protein D9M68_815410 [compost metagenome]
MVNKHPCYHCLGLELSELELGVLEVGQGLPEHLALGDVVDGVVDHRFYHHRRTDGLGQAFLGEVFHQQLEASVLGAEQVAGRHAQVLKK